MLKRVKKKSKLLRCFLSWLPEEVLLPNNICAFPERKAREEEAKKGKGQPAKCHSCASIRFAIVIAFSEICQSLSSHP